MKKIICFIFIISLCLSFCSISASADVGLLTQMAGAAYAVMQGAGISFTASTATSAGMQSFMETQINDYCGESGQSLIEAFGSDQLRIVAGKLAIAQTAYNGIVDFIDWLSDKFNLSDSESYLSAGSIPGIILNQGTPCIAPSERTNIGFEATESGTQTIRTTNPQGETITYTGFSNTALYYNGQSISARTWPTNYCGTGYFKLELVEINNNKTKYNVYFSIARILSGEIIHEYFKNNGNPLTYNSTPDNNLKWQETQSYVEPTFIPSSKEWQGDYTGIDTTSIETVIGGIFSAIGTNTLDVTDEIVDVGPAPTPIPTIDPITPWSDVPYSGYSDYMEGLNDLIGDQTGVIDQGLNDLQDISEQNNSLLGDITGWLEDILDWLQEWWEAAKTWFRARYDEILDGIDSLTDILSDILSAVTDLAGTIENALVTEIETILGTIPTVFGQWFDNLNASWGIWHYVIEWIQCISTPFNWMMTIFNGLPACFKKPIYACVAGSLCIAVLKRFGR